MGTKFKGIKTAAEYRRGEITKDILRLVGAGVIMAGAIAAPNAVQLIDMFDPKSPRERNRIWKALKYLESKRHVELDNEGAHTFVRLTESGKRRLDEERIWEMTIQSPRRWDRKWRLVLFDIPARSETIRQSFRQKLEDFGLKLYQRSVFIYPHECYEQVTIVAKWYGVDMHVRYIVAEEINDARKFLKEFDLA